MRGRVVAPCTVAKIHVNAGKDLIRFTDMTFEYPYSVHDQFVFYLGIKHFGFSAVPA